MSLNHIAEQLAPLKRVLDTLPEVKAPKLLPCPDDMETCRSCGRKMPRSDIKYSRTLILPRCTDIVCDECWKLLDGYSRLVCLNCGMVAARMKPAVDPSGFVFKRNAFYHVDMCVECTQPITKSVLIEKRLFDQERGIHKPWV